MGICYPKGSPFDMIFNLYYYNCRIVNCLREEYNIFCRMTEPDRNLPQGILVKTMDDSYNGSEILIF